MFIEAANGKFGSNVIPQSPPLQVHPCNSLVDRWVASWLQQQQPVTTLYVISHQQLSKIPKMSKKQLQSAKGHKVQLECRVEQSACAGTRKVLIVDEEPWLAKQGPDRFGVLVKVLKASLTDIIFTACNNSW